MVGLIPAFEEEANIGPAVTSLLDVGCDRVVVLDGAYVAPGRGQSFLGGACRSRDDTVAEAQRAGAEVMVPPRQPRFGEKREMLLRMCRARPGDRVFFLDADERAAGKLPQRLPRYALVTLRNLKPNDLPDLRGTFPRGDYGAKVPLLRILQWSPSLSFGPPGRFYQGQERIDPYQDGKPVLPVLRGVQVLHVAPASPERVAEKRRFYPLSKAY